MAAPAQNDATDAYLQSATRVAGARALEVAGGLCRAGRLEGAVVLALVVVVVVGAIVQRRRGLLERGIEVARRGGLREERRRRRMEGGGQVVWLALARRLRVLRVRLGEGARRQRGCVLQAGIDGVAHGRRS